MSVDTATRERAIEASIFQSVLEARYPREALPTIAGNRDMTLDQLKEILDRGGYPDTARMKAHLRRLLADQDPDAGEAGHRDRHTQGHRTGTAPAPVPAPPKAPAVPTPPPVKAGGAPKPAPFVTALPVHKLFADPAYQRELDLLRVERMSRAFDIALVGIIEVAERDDGASYAILDGQHRWATVKDHAFDTEDDPHIVCRVHRGLTITEEAALYHQLNTTRKQLTGWDRWVARRTAQEQLVLDIEACCYRQGLVIAMSEGPNVVRATKACENVVELGGIILLENVLALIRVAYPDDQAGLDAAILQGLALVVNFYRADELDHDRLVQSLASILPRQLTARADAVRELHKGTRDRLTAHVIVERYNTGKGPRIQPFFDRVKPLTKAKKDAAGRRATAIREWAQRTGVMDPGKTLITRRIRAAYDDAHPNAEVTQ